MKPEYHLTVKEMPVDIRPRERMIALGPEALSNVELLAIILRTGSQKETSLQLATKILGTTKGLRVLAEAGVEELSKFKGVGQAKAAQIKAAVELGRRVIQAAGQSRQQIKSPHDVARLLVDEMRFLDREHFRVICLNTKNYVLSIDEVSVGSLNSSIVHPRELFKKAIMRSAAGVILIHNHPSGDPAPSREDLDVTRRIVEAGRILGIEVLDHVIIGDGRYISLKEQGSLD